MKPLFGDLKGKKVLDLGCNAGYFCLQCARAGAEVYGVEPHPEWFQQALFIRSWFRSLEKVDYELLNIGMKDIKWKEIGDVDFVIAMAVLRLVKEEIKKPFKRLLNHTNNIMIREMKMDYYRGYMDCAGFEEVDNVEFYSRVTNDSGVLHLFRKIEK